MIASFVCMCRRVDASDTRVRRMLKEEGIRRFGDSRLDLIILSYCYTVLYNILSGGFYL